MKVTRTEAIKSFLKSLTHEDLADLYSLEMECQVNVAQDGGEKTEGEFKGRQWHGWTDGVQTWKSFRIPRNASTTPEYEDTRMSYDLAAHAEGIGMTGWDWKNKVSRWVAFDFDSIAGHKDNHIKKLTDEELEKIKESLNHIDWVTIRKSTGGKGLHVYVFLEPITTLNHNEHAALARSILGKLSSIVGYDFDAKVDTCGSNMWVWHRKMTKENGGLSIIKRGGKLTEVPVNWKDHIKVVTGHRKRNLPKFLSTGESAPLSDAEKLLEELTGITIEVPLDDEHKKLINWLEEHKTQSWWDADRHMLVTHTYHLKQAFDELGFRGIFTTIAKGTEAGHDHNCFSGDTEVITKEGVFTLKELAKKGEAELYVMNSSGQMHWIKSKIYSFGIQKTYPVLFSNNISVRATLDHSWLIQSNKVNIWNRRTTGELTPRTRLPFADFELPPIDFEGYAHGFTYGDGWVRSKDQKCDVAFFKNDEDLISIFNRFASCIGYQKYNNEYVQIARGLPGHWKSLPEKCSKSYALGFILGLISADGFISSCIQIFQSNYFELEEIRKLAIYAGLRARGIRKYGTPKNRYFKNSKQGYALTIDTYNLSKEHFLRKDHKERFNKKKKCFSTSARVLKTQPKEEEVFCAVVPRFANFTLSSGVITSNCFMFAIRGGGWTVRRFGMGTAETPSWDQDGRGWTRCFFNIKPDIGTACRSLEGIERPSGGFVFKHAEMALDAAKLIGAPSLNVHPALRTKKAYLKGNKNGKLVVEVEGDKDGILEADMKGWLFEKGLWKKVVNADIHAPIEADVSNYEDVIRHIVNANGNDCGWVLKGESGEWRLEPLKHIIHALESMGTNPKDIKGVIGTSVLKYWRLVNKPFQAEYPGNRLWNRGAAQLKFVPSQNEERTYPTWRKILNHLGKGLDDALQNNAWAKANGVTSGSDYLKIWLSSLFKEPMQPLPYLFFWGNQNCGKSIFHEAIELLLTKGYQRAEAALTNDQGFNGQLDTAVVCVIEEIDLKKNRQAASRIKDWVTARQISIHPKGQTPYLIPNSTHWIQCSNDPNFCPIFPGDTRITMVHVEEIDPIEMIPKKDMIPLLEQEAPDFLAELLSVEIPPSNDRLNVPVISTADKMDAEMGNRSQLESFLAEKCYFVPGKMIKLGELYDRFREFCDPQEVANWSKVRMGKELPHQYPKGRSRTNAEHYVGNISFTPSTPEDRGLKKLKKVMDQRQQSWLEPENDSTGSSK